MPYRQFVAAALLAVVAPFAQAADVAGVVKVAKGAVSLERATGRVAVAPGTSVTVADRVVTGPDGSVGILLRDDTMLSAGPNTTLVLDRYAFDSTTHAGTLDASVRRGTLSVVSGKIAKQSPETVRFHTPNAILGVRGTEFVIDAGEGSR